MNKKRKINKCTISNVNIVFLYVYVEYVLICFGELTTFSNKKFPKVSTWKINNLSRRVHGVGVGGGGGGGRSSNTPPPPLAPFLLLLACLSERMGMNDDTPIMPIPCLGNWLTLLRTTRKCWSPPPPPHPHPRDFFRTGASSRPRTYW